MKFKKTLALLIFLTSSYANAITIKIATLAPDGSSYMNAIKQATDRVSKKTNNRVKFRFYPGGIMGTDSSVIRKIRVGQLHGGAIAAGTLKNLAQSTQIYGIPFTFNNEDEVLALRNKYDSVMKQELKQVGFELLGVTSGGFAYLMSENKITNLADFRKQKAWLPDDDVIAQAVFNQAGINPILLPISDVYTSLQTGLINTIAINPTAAILLQWYSKLNYVVDVPLAMLTGIFVIDSRVMKKLNKADAQVVAYELEKTFKELDKQNIQEEKNARIALTEAGIKFIKLDQKMSKSFKTYTNNSLKTIPNKYPKKLYEELLKDLAAIRNPQAK